MAPTGRIAVANRAQIGLLSGVATDFDARARAKTAAAGGEQLRVQFAAERTLLAWLRTGLAMMGFGFIVARFGLFLREIAAIQQLPDTGSPRLSVWIGTALVTLGVAACLLAALGHARFAARLRRGEVAAAPSLWSGIAMAGVLALVGIAMTAYLLAFTR